MENKMGNSVRYQLFLEGEHVDLCIPNHLAIEEDGWAEWFNNTDLLQATGHGIYPNHRSSQQKILESLASDRSKIVLLICQKGSRIAIGVVSLQSISLQNRSAEIAINASGKHLQAVHPFATLEAMSMITEHGFDQLGLIRIYGGQAIPILENWNKMTELIGYRTEGILRNSFTRGHRVTDTAAISCTYNDYVALRTIRGSLWGSSKLIRNVMKKQPSESYATLLSDHMKSLENEYFKFLFSD